MNKSNKLHKIAAQFILEKDINIQIKGSEKFVKCYSSLLSESRNLYNAIKEGNLDKIISCTELKKDSAKKFEEVSGITWRL